MPLPAEIDWLARKVGSVINFRLEDDPPAIPPDTLSDRRHAYLLQLRARMSDQKLTRCAKHHPTNWRDYFGTCPED